jgi:hypothetical protein
MLIASDLIHLPFTPDLTAGGITYACRSLAYTFDRMGDSPIDSLRQSVADVAAELAFRHYLGQQAVPFHIRETSPFTHPSRAEITLGGHRCLLQNPLITRRSLITQLRRDPDRLLQAPVLLPVDPFSAEGHRPDDLYLFTFLLGLVTAGQAEVGKAVAAGQPAFLVHPLPEKWAVPADWIPLRKIALKSECDSPVPVELGGLDNGRNFITTRLELPPRQRILVEVDFHSLAYLHVEKVPQARIGLHHPLHGGPVLILPNDWHNLWVYGMDILLAGWLTHEEYCRKARVLNTGSRTFHGTQTHEKNLMVPLAELHPLEPLLKRVCRWEIERITYTQPGVEKPP